MVVLISVIGIFLPVVIVEGISLMGRNGVTDITVLVTLLIERGGSVN